jgi:RHS repeat-associated protein
MIAPRCPSTSWTTDSSTGLAYGVDTAGILEIYHADGLGSTRALTNAGGQVIQSYQTDEFGVPTATVGGSGQPFRYTGEQRDSESGLIYLRARMYDPAIGRFLQRDRFGGLNTSSPTLNRFSYVENNPITGTDPSGLSKNRNGDDRQPLGCYDLINNPDWRAPRCMVVHVGVLTTSDGNILVYVPGPFNGATDPGEGGDLGGYRSIEGRSGLGREGNRPPLRVLHSEETLREGGSLEQIRKQSSEEIIESLKPNAKNPLTVKADGTVVDGNTRVFVLRERGVDVDQLPRVLHETYNPFGPGSA